MAKRAISDGPVAGIIASTLDSRRVEYICTPAIAKRLFINLSLRPKWAEGPEILRPYAQWCTSPYPLWEYLNT